MGNANIHKKQSDLNEQAANRAMQSGCYDWAVTICFYAALHYIEAYAQHVGCDIGKEYSHIRTQHERRLAYVLDIDYDLNLNNSLNSSYEMLYEASMTARYLTGLGKGRTARSYFKFICNDYFECLSTIKTKIHIP